MSVPYDQRLANEAAAVDQCIKLGGVLLKPTRKRAFFTEMPSPPEPPKPPDD